jgi:hypothetical protein
MRKVLAKALAVYVAGLEEMMEKQGQIPIDAKLAIYGGDNLEYEIQIAKSQLVRLTGFYAKA